MAAACAKASAFQVRAPERNQSLTCLPRSKVSVPSSLPDRLDWLPCVEDTGDMGSQCSLFGAFGWFVQAILFFTSSCPLLWKWWNENPRRTFLTLVLDSSKQVAGNLGVHFINLALSATFASAIKPVDSCGDEECLWYFLNFVIDVFLGMPLNYFILMFLKNLAERREWTLIQGFGDYKHKGDVEAGNSSFLSTFSLKRFGAQLLAWLGIVAVGKLFLCVIILSEASNLLQMSASLLASVRCHNASSTVELLVVMLVIPTILNALQFWITDSFIKFYSKPGKLSKVQTQDTEGKTLLPENHYPGSPKHERSPLIRNNSRID